MYQSIVFEAMYCEGGGRGRDKGSVEDVSIALTTPFVEREELHGDWGV